MEKINRFINACVLLLLSIADGLYEWLLHETNPQLNAGFWIASFWGSFISKIVKPPKTRKESFYSLLVGFVGSLYASGSMHYNSIDEKKWYCFLIALFFDLVVRGFMWIAQKFSETPEQSIDENIERAKKIKDIFGIDFFKGLFNRNTK